ncbi:hypothetical protein BpHYR1_001134 [Brachionus plicatilis]|uniref:Uncharacterized protein n=1 Tax=Brachionus plicatilis TaxID=10195 RepID=A0A3M7T071_BRAPC|nr:hypothetical protein BpHYR1_001134 [Brachionus plicatilis]
MIEFTYFFTDHILDLCLILSEKFLKIAILLDFTLNSKRKDRYIDRMDNKGRDFFFLFINFDREKKRKNNLIYQAFTVGLKNPFRLKNFFGKKLLQIFVQFVFEFHNTLEQQKFHVAKT